MKNERKMLRMRCLLDIVGPAVLVLRRLPAEGQAGAAAVPGGLWGQPPRRARHVAGGDMVKLGVNWVIHTF